MTYARTRNIRPDYLAAIHAHLGATGTLPDARALAEATGVSQRHARRLLTLHGALGAAPQETPGPVPAPTITGVTAQRDSLALERDAVARALAGQARSSAGKTVQTIAFPSGPICLVFLGDQHMGNPGTDYARLFAEAQLVRDTPGMYAITMGDLLDQFIIGRLATVRFGAQLSIDDEWHLVRHYVRTLGPKLIAAVGGNHDGWAQALTGIDWMREVIAQINPNCLYDSDDSRINVVVGDRVTRLRIRHAWLGSSIYNPTHAIEKAAKWDADFDLGVGAHTHVGGFCRDSVSGGRHVLAVQVGTYKRADAFARRLGFPMSNNSTAIAVVLDRDGTMQGFNNLAFAAEYMRLRYQGDAQ